MHRYRTQPCNDGPACARKVCFFAHTLDELRVPTEEADDDETASPLNNSSDSGEVEPLGSTLEIDQRGTDANCESTEELRMSLNSPFLSHLAWKGNDLECLRRSESGTAARPATASGISYRSKSSPAAAMPQQQQHQQHQTYFMSSLASSSLMPQWKGNDSRGFLDDKQQQSHHLEKALSDLINDSDTTAPQHQQQQHRMPLTNFNIQNYDTSALESGLHWNGGPPKLFVERGNSLTRSSLHSTLSSDVENSSGELSDSIVISKPFQLFLLASQLSNFGGF